MNKITSVLLSRVSIAITMGALSACGGSSSSSSANSALDELEDIVESASDNAGVIAEDNNTVTTPANTFTVRDISELPPLAERLYGGVNYGVQITGPIAGSGLLTNSEIINEIPVVITNPADGIVFEKMYVIDNYDTDEGEIEFDTAEPTLMGVVTNTSDVTMCNIRITDGEAEMNNGEVQLVSIDVYGYITYSPVEVNFLRDLYDNMCIPAGMSVFLNGTLSSFFRQFDDLRDDAGNPLSGDDTVRLTIGEVRASVERSNILDTSGLFATAYDDEFSGTLNNPSDRNLRIEGFYNTVFLIDSETGIPIHRTGLSIGGERPITPGQDVPYSFNPEELLGSTNTILVLPTWSDNDSR